MRNSHRRGKVGGIWPIVLDPGQLSLLILLLTWAIGSSLVWIGSVLFPSEVAIFEVSKKYKKREEKEEYYSVKFSP